MFSQPVSSPDIVSQARQARDARALKQKREASAIVIQSVMRGFLCRKRFSDIIRNEFDNIYSKFSELDKTLTLPTAQVAFTSMRQLIFIFDHLKDKQRFLCICRYLLLSMESSDLKNNIIMIALSKDYILHWVALMKKILWRTCIYLDVLKPDLPSDSKIMNLYLHVLVSFTACNSWPLIKSKQGEALKSSLNQLCANILGHIVDKGIFITLQNLLRKGLARKQPSMKHVTLSAITSLSLRPLVGSNFSDTLTIEYVIRILSIPGYVLHLNTIAQESMALIMTHKLFARTLVLLSSEHNSKVLIVSDGAAELLCLLANVIHMAYLDKNLLVENLLDFTNVVTRLFEACKSNVTSKKSATSHWHPVLGWFSQSIDTYVSEGMGAVVTQLHLLWSADMVQCLFSDLVNLLPILSDSDHHSIGGGAKLHVIDEKTSTLVTPVKNLFRKLVDHNRTDKLNCPSKRFGSIETTIVALVSSLYQNALTTLTQLRYDILSGLCYQDFLLPRLWYFICSLGSQNGLKPFLDLLSMNSKATNPEFQILVLFCEACTYLLTIIDDIELYEEQKPLKMQDLCTVSYFMNHLIFKSIWDGLIDIKSAVTHPLILTAHSLVILLYNRDCRRSFTKDENFWLIKELKPSLFLTELDKGCKKAEFLVQKVPHIIPHKERVQLFRKYVAAEKESNGYSPDDNSSARTPTLITIHRSRIVEDGYRQLSLLPSQSMKGLIRVKFINEQGLDEAGIDQDGVFKEFLEESIKRIYNPSLNLFKETSEGQLYPSPTSNVHENYLALFDFVGRILAKAIYEGIVVEVPFATFFLNHLLGRSSSSTYSSFDELPSLDADLYKSLTYIKHYAGDASDLELTFSSVEDYMGQVITHELVPGGKTILVTNENKISYVHLMAHFRMYTQIKDQLHAFIRGFRALIKPEWLQFFSAPELQKLISGDTEDIDLDDLRKHTQYYGGFHNSHRVVNWLWEILDKEFNSEERKLFLRFVTSCSKPPLLGFAYLEPPFSIRCVEVADDQDQGDTLGSVIRGFLTIRRRDPVGRLPTSSTCFNLLKLPNYQKRSTLRDKLRFAILHGTGFELS